MGLYVYWFVCSNLRWITAAARYFAVTQLSENSYPPSRENSLLCFLPFFFSSYLSSFRSRCHFFNELANTPNSLFHVIIIIIPFFYSSPVFYISTRRVYCIFATLERRTRRVTICLFITWVILLKFKLSDGQKTRAVTVFFALYVSDWKHEFKHGARSQPCAFAFRHRDRAKIAVARPIRKLGFADNIVAMRFSDEVPSEDVGNSLWNTFKKRILESKGGKKFN